MTYYAGIGSRDTPGEIGVIMTSLAAEMERCGWILRSGGARGADTFFERGVVEVDNKEIFIHKDYVRSGHRHDPAASIFNAARFQNWHEAMRIAAEIHPKWHKCNDDAQGLHARNIYQVLGPDMDPDTYSSMVICWGIPDIHGVPEGGTRTAWKVAERFGIQRFNLAVRKDRVQITDWLASRQAA